MRPITGGIWRWSTTWALASTPTPARRGSWRGWNPSGNGVEFGSESLPVGLRVVVGRRP